MCGPALPMLALAATAITATGQIVSGVQAQHQAGYQAAVANQNAALVRQQEQDAALAQAQQRVQLDRKYSALEGSQRVAMAANGLDLNFGSARQVAEDTAMLHAEDADALAHNQEAQIRGFEIQASNYHSQAAAARMQGDSAMTSAIFGAGSSILGGAQQYAKFKRPGMGY